MAFNFRKFFQGIQIVPKTSSTVNSAGDLDFSTSSNKMNLHNGSSASPIVTEDHSATLKNKGLEDTSVFINDSSDPTKQIKFNAAGTTGTSTTITSAQTSDIIITLPSSSGTLITSGGGGGSLSNILLDDTTVPFVDTGDNSKRIYFDAGGTASTSTTIAAAQTANRTLTLPDLTDTLISRVSTDQGANRLKNKDLEAQTSLIVDSSDPTKKLQFQVSGFTPGATNTLIPPNTSGTIVLRDSLDQGAQALQNKDLNAVTVNFINSIDSTKKMILNPQGTTGTSTTLTSTQTSNINLTLPDVTDTLVARNTTDTLQNKTLAQNVTFDADNLRDVGTSLAGARNIYYSGFEDRGEISTPSNPASSRHRVYFKSDGQLYKLDSAGNETQVGSGGGSGGVNFITLNTSFQPINQDNFNAESTIGNWAAYADAAASTPVDMTGGSPTVAISRTTTVGEVLDGSGSFKVVKDAANRQGEGVSCVANIPLGYRGKPATVQVPLKIISGTMVSGDVKAYAYDVTNSQVITPFNNDVFGNSVTLRMTFDIPPTCAQIRFGFHFASTSTNAVTFTFDDIFVGAQDVSFGPAITDFQLNSSFSFTGIGTVTNQSVYTRRVGDSLEVYGKAIAGTPTAVAFTLNLPTGIIIDATKLTSDSNSQRLGFLERANGSGSWPTTSNGPYPIYFDGINYDKVFIAQGASSSLFTPANGNSVVVSGDNVTFQFIVPISSWSTNSINSNSNTFRISNVLVNGTRVTSTPTQLGEYRTYIKDAGATSGTDNAPSVGPSSADGMLIYGNVPAASAGTSGQPGRWEVFVGKNKQCKIEFYANAGRTGNVSVDRKPLNAVFTREQGLDYSYDPTTGIVLIDGFDQDGGVTLRDTGVSIPTGGGTTTYITGGVYFDVIVSESIIPVQSQSVRSEVQVDTEAGFGSTATKIRLFSVIRKNIGTAITYTSDSVNGDKFTINEDGVYSISYTDGRAGPEVMGISLNSSQLSTSILSINATDRLQVCGLDGSTSASLSNVSVCTVLSKGDVVRAHTDASQSNGTNPTTTKFIITKIAN